MIIAIASFLLLSISASFCAHLAFQDNFTALERGFACLISLAAGLVSSLYFIAAFYGGTGTIYLTGLIGDWVIHLPLVSAEPVKGISSAYLLLAPPLPLIIIGNLWLAQKFMPKKSL